jgi:hypothetical protein
LCTDLFTHYFVYNQQHFTSLKPKCSRNNKVKKLSYLRNLIHRFEEQIRPVAQVYQGQVPRFGMTFINPGWFCSMLRNLRVTEQHQTTLRIQDHKEIHAPGNQLTHRPSSHLNQATQKILSTPLNQQLTHCPFH